MVHKGIIYLSTKNSISQTVTVNHQGAKAENVILIMRDAVAIPAEHRQVVVDICLGKFVRKLLEILYRLRNLKAIRVDSTVRVLSQAEFLCKKRKAVPEFRHNLNRLVQVCIGHGVSWRRGQMTGWL